MRRVVWFLLVSSCLACITPSARADSHLVIGVWPTSYTQFAEIDAASGISIPYFRGRMRDGQFDTTLVGTDAHTAAAAGESLGLNIQPKTGTGSHRTGILYTDITAQLLAGSGPYYDKLVSFANEVSALPTYGVVPNYLQFHSEASTQAPPGVPAAQPFSGTGPEYQECYALVHQLFDSMGVTNQIYWQVVLARGTYVGGQGGPGAWFPSDPSLYDLVGVDAYYKGNTWLSPSVAFGAALSFAQPLGKQIWIDEVGADEGGPAPQSATAKAAWFASLDTYLEANLPSVAGVVFSHANDGGNWFLDSQLSGGRTAPNYTGLSWTGWKTTVTALDAAAQPTHQLSVAVAGSGDGTVTSTPSGINCPGSCGEELLEGDSADLAAAADPGSIFTGWSGDCTGTGSCSLTMNGAKDVTAHFELQHDLSVVTVGGGTNSVTSDVGGIDCPATTCSANDLLHGSHVLLTAIPDAGFALAGWSGGGCDGSALTCDVTMDDDHVVTATFEAAMDLSVTLDGGGTGTVTSTPNDEISCPSTCTNGFATDGSVTLHAAAGANSIFTGWSSADEGFDCTGTGDCVVTMNITRSVTATFEPAHMLQVVRVGTGPGAVTSDVAAIDCGTTCTHLFRVGATVTLHAADGDNALFDSWSGDTEDACPGTGDCTVTMDQARTVTATYSPILHQLLVIRTGGTGNGTVTSLAPNPGIDCGDTCQFDFQQGSSVVLRADADGTSVFTGWTGGGCTGTTPTCSVTMGAEHTVTAMFDAAVDLTVSLAGSGTGTVTTPPNAEIDCPSTCANTFLLDNSVTLHAAPSASSNFMGWGGACSASGSAMTCNLTMDAAKTVTATFMVVQHPLTVSKLGVGTGVVTSGVVGINCGSACSVSYDHGTAVVLTATPDANMTFDGWGGACSGSGVCDVTMDAAKSVSATFSRVQHNLSVTKAGSGTGSISSDLGGINCPGSCSINYDHGASVILSATPTGGSTFAGWSGGVCSGPGTCSVTMDAAKSVTGTFNPPVTTSALRDNDDAVTYNGWAGVADVAATNGFFRVSDVKNDTVTWQSPATTSITVVTRTGPTQGKVSVTIDGKNKGILDAYSAVPAPLNKVYSGLANKAHTIVIEVLHTKNNASTAFSFRLDGFVVGATTTQDSDPKVQYDSWKSASQSLATDGTYRSSAAASATLKVAFTGTSIDWITAKGKAYGKASVKIDGVVKGTVDLYQSATSWRSAITYVGLSPGSHTMLIQVLGQKNTKATGKTVVVDGFIVHG